MRSGQVVALLPLLAATTSGRYLGLSLGRFTDTVAGVGGAVHAVDSQTVVITDFSFDGADPGKEFPSQSFLSIEG